MKDTCTTGLDCFDIMCYIIVDLPNWTCLLANAFGADNVKK